MANARRCWIAAWSTGLGTVAALVALGVLWSGLLQHRAQSFDVMLYARGLWGLAHGDGNNPVAGTATLAVHFHGGLLVLAPLARWIGGVQALIVAQALALGATVAITVAAGLRALSPNDGDALRWGGAWATLLGGATWLSCWTINPFFFDVRPDLLAVPLALAGLLRLQRSQRIDAGVAALTVAAVLMREEMAMTIAAAALVAPGVRADLRARLLLALAVIGLWAAYLLWGRTWLGGAGATARLDGTVGVFLGTPPTQWPAQFWALAGNRASLLATAAATLGGAALLGGRWWLAAAPGLAWVLVSLRTPDDALRYHYPLFAAPALLVAGVAGLKRLRTRADRGQGWHWGTLRVTALTGWRCLGIPLSAVLAWHWSTAPGFPRYAAGYYGRLGQPTSPEVARAHALLDAHVSDHEGAVVPWTYVGDRSDRAMLWTQYQLRDAIAGPAPLPQTLTVIALPTADARPLHPTLTTGLGWRSLTDWSEPVQIYRRSPATQELHGQ